MQSETPERSNVLGRIWQRHGFRVNFRPCPYLTRRTRNNAGAPNSDDSMVPLSTTQDAGASANSTTSRPGNALPPKQKRRSSFLCGLGPSKDEEEEDDHAHAAVGQTQTIEATCFISSPTSAPSTYSNWMAELPLHATNKPFNQLSIPGSHDSCTASLDRDGGLHPDAPELYRDVLRVLGSWAKTVAHRWSQTQDRTFVEQLDLGIRYFDLRISVRPGFPELYLVHGFYGECVRHCLTTVSSWLDSHPKEVVLLDMNHFHGLEDQHHQKLVDDIHDIFNEKLVPVRNDARELTLAQMWKERRQVIVFYHHVKSGVSFPNPLQPTFDFLWPGSMIPSPWPRATRIKDLIDFLDRNTQHNHFQQHTASNQHSNQNSPTSPSPPPSTIRTPGNFYVSQGVLTPTVYTVIGHVTSSLKDHFARQAAHAIVDWLRRRRKQMTSSSSSSAAAAAPATASPVGGVVKSGGNDPPSDRNGLAINIVIVDFVDLEPAYVEAVVSLNYVERASPPSSVDAFQHLSPVLQFLQQQQQHEQPPRSAEVMNRSLAAGQCHPSQLLPHTGDAVAASSSALSSRALTPTPLQFIDAGANSPSVTPLRHGATAEGDG